MLRRTLLGFVLAATSIVFVPAAQAVVCPTIGSVSTPVTLANAGSEVIEEASGVVKSGDYSNTLWDLEDGSGGKVYAHQSGTGAHRATITLNATVSDTEDIAIKRNSGTDQIVVFDTGDNNHNRSTVRVLVFDEPDPASGNATVTPTVYPFTYTDADPNGSKTVHPDVEAAVVDAGGAYNLFFFSKDRDSIYGANSGGSGRKQFSVYNGGNWSNLSTSGNVATYETSIAGLTQGSWDDGKRTGPVAADISSDRQWLIVKNYQEGLLWERDSGAGWAATLAGNDESDCKPIATGSGKYEGVAFHQDVTKLFQVQDDKGGSASPVRQQDFTP